ncbi:Replication-associated recombination protein A [Thalassoglobus neptunius]|uniref:Replication-associated recombination protein A n=1 Tax=Thalassoglobus neptunius TaxID=1938619 RepID=A0A5C5X595_9PLAN|nr:replication-associated recombination protein A [Thalassoglobus neptunius]TWT57501.1 Replication-associated recombination protein A [Thalassoglobus neptunius]
MAGLFDKQEEQERTAAQPLAARMRPQNLDEFVGQQHFLGEGMLLRRMLQADRLGSMIFYGPPGTGKTSLGQVIASQTRCSFRILNAAAAGVKELRTELNDARDRLSRGDGRTILFVDELHHFNRTQQDVLLPDVESGVVNLIAATTANPFFSLASALISRSQVFEFKPISQEDISQLLWRALTDKQRGLGSTHVEATDEAIEFLAEVSEGDARRALTALEIGVLSLGEKHSVFDLTVAQESIQKKAVVYDASGDQHYDVTSAFIKSIRGSDPDAAIYWLARMLVAGEDPRFIARRLVILASEDVGNADPHGLVLANSAAEATERVGMPECRIILAQAVTYLASCPKSNASYMAINAAIEDVENHRSLPVPEHLKDAHYAGAKSLGHGEGYQYSHNSEDGWVAQDYLGVPKTYYSPVDRGYESILKRRLEKLRTRKQDDLPE